jgi:formate dehydrogenase subunit delta
MQTRDMLRMANQIAQSFKSYPREEALVEAANHINNFWTPTMRGQLLAHVAAGGAGLDPLLVEAAQRIRKPNLQKA